jgi:hypothetical protein
MKKKFKKKKMVKDKRGNDTRCVACVWHAPVVPVTQETETGGLLELRS